MSHYKILFYTTMLFLRMRDLPLSCTVAYCALLPCALLPCALCPIALYALSIAVPIWQLSRSGGADGVIS
jgi:hypothetical protein